MSMCGHLHFYSSFLCSPPWHVISANAIMIGTYMNTSFVYIFFASEFCSDITEPCGQDLKQFRCIILVI